MPRELTQGCVAQACPPQTGFSLCVLRMWKDLTSVRHTSPAGT